MIKSLREFAPAWLGLARYFNIDPVIIRVIWGVSFFAYGIGLLPYLIFWVILPEE